MEDDQAPVMWRKSTYSNDEGACLEVAEVGMARLRLVRDSKQPGEMLVLTAAQWAAFTAGVKAGEFD